MMLKPSQSSVFITVHIFLIILVEIKLKCEFEGACYENVSIVKNLLNLNVKDQS